MLVLCGGAVALLAIGLLAGAASLLPWPLVLLGAGYSLDLADGPVDQWAPVYAGAFVVIAELAYWSLELRGRAEDLERLTERRAGLIVAFGIGAVAIGGLVLAATSVDLGSGIGIDALGVVAAVAAVFVLAVAARRA